MTTTLLTLFDVTALDPAADVPCTRCSGSRPATIRVRAARNLLATMRPEYAPTHFRDAARISSSGPCCEECAWQLGHAWWGTWRVCPSGVCALWAHTLATPLPGWDCRRHHEETTVVWQEPVGVAA